MTETRRHYVIEFVDPDEEEVKVTTVWARERPDTILHLDGGVYVYHGDDYEFYPNHIIARVRSFGGK